MVYHWNNVIRGGSTASITANWVTTGGRSGGRSDNTHLDELKPSDVLLRCHSKGFTAAEELVGFTLLIGPASPFLSSISKTHSCMHASCHEDMAFLCFLWAIVMRCLRDTHRATSVGLAPHISALQAHRTINIFYYTHIYDSNHNDSLTLKAILSLVK